MRAVVVRRLGGPDVLNLAEVDDPRPGPGEVRIRLRYAGVNFLDIHRRRKLQPTPLPYIPGMEGSGVIESRGPRVRSWNPGDRVAIAMVPATYAEMVVVPANRVVPVPTGLSLELAAGSLLQGLTAHAFTHDVSPVHAGMTVLVHSVAGGTGTLIAQMALARGATVFGSVSSPAKLGAADIPGIGPVIVRHPADFSDAVAEHTGGRGVDVIYDGVGRDTFEGNLRSLAPRGRLVLFGQASGPVPPFDLLRLAQGSKSVTFAVVSSYISTTAALRRRARYVFAAVSRGDLRVSIEGVYPIERVDEAHRRVESGEAAGKLLVDVGSS